jgi:lysophospholipase L1-like esterase
MAETKEDSPMLRLLPALFLLVSFGARAQDDWADLARFAADNAALGAPADDEARVVFLGDSITVGWSDAMPAFFEGKPYVERGIGGQTTPQMLVRFRADVVDLAPAAVVILAGTNDIAGNTGEASNKMIQDNLASMAEIATANGIRVVLASILPAADYPWSPGREPAGRIAAINSWIRSYAGENGHVFLDYYSALVDDRGGMQAMYTTDGVHVSAAGYSIMAGLAEAAIAEALGAPRPEQESGASGIFFRPLEGCPRTTSSKRPVDCE